MSRGLSPGHVIAEATAARIASAFSGTPSAASQSLRRGRRQAGRRGLDDARAVGAEAHLRVRRTVANAQSLGRRARRVDGIGDIVLDGQTCANATPNAGGSAVRRSAFVSARNDPSTEKALTVTSGPSTYSSATNVPLRDASRAAAIVAGSRGGCLTPASASLTLAIGSSATHGALGSSSCRGCGTPAAARAARRRVLFVASNAVAGEIGCGSPSRSAISGSCDADRPVGAGRDQPAPTFPARASRSTPGRSSVETIARLDASSKPGAEGSRSTTMVSTSQSCAARRSPSCAGPAPRTRRGRGRGSPATSPRSRSTRRPSARVPPRSRRTPACQGRQLVGRADVPVHWIEPLFHVNHPGVRPDRLEHEPSHVPDGDVHAGRHVHDLADHGIQRRRDDRLDRLGVVVDVEPVATRMPVSVHGQRLAGERLRDEARHDLLRMPGPVVVERAARSRSAART